jgi:hypothetical protein
METTILRQLSSPKVSKSVSTSAIVVSTDPLSPTPSISSAKRTPDPWHTGPSATLTGTEAMPENKEGDSDNPEQQLKELSKWNTPLISCTVQVLEQQQNITHKNSGQYSYYLIIQNI